MSKSLFLLLGAVVVTASFKAAEVFIRVQVVKSVNKELKRQVELINTAPLLRRLGIAWRVIRGNL